MQRQEPSTMLFQPSIPNVYTNLSQDEIAARVLEHKQRFGQRLVILGHHYQQDDVIRFADFTGDSLKLSQIAAEQKQAEFVVFCGVHFMAESADILTDDAVAVILPDLSAGCSMADMADIDQVEEAWDTFRSQTDATIIPITYVNSAATIKAFCGDHGGACCTSSNARQILEWAFRHGDKVLFLPDQHLGRNTAYAMGVPLEQMTVYDPNEKGVRLLFSADRSGGEKGVSSDEQGVRINFATGITETCPENHPDTFFERDARVILWKGHCSVHQLFTAEQCDQIRQSDPDMKIVVHPECDWAVVQKADLAGSTEYILRTINDAPPGSKWAVGTEVHLVHRLAQQHADKTVRSLANIQCLCTTMYRISPQHLLWSLDELAAGRLTNRITVPPETKRSALTALNRMLANVSAQPVGAK